MLYLTRPNIQVLPFHCFLGSFKGRKTNQICFPTKDWDFLQARGIRCELNVVWGGFNPYFKPLALRKSIMWPSHQLGPCQDAPSVM